MRKILLLAGALMISGCASEYHAGYSTSCNTTDADLQLRVHQIATDLGAKAGAPVKHGESLLPAIEYDIDLAGGGELAVREYAGKITVDIENGSDEVAMKRVRDLVEATLKQNNCEGWELS